MSKDQQKTTNQQRFHREDPTRTRPTRNWSALYRQSDAREAAHSPESPQSTDHETPQAPPWADVMSQSVNLGYRVIEDYIRQGQRAAQQANDRSYNVGTTGNDIRDLVERMARYYADLGALWGDLINSFAANPDFLNNLSRALQPQPAPANGASAQGSSANGVPGKESVTIAIEVISSRPTQVMLDLPLRPEQSSLIIHGLRAADPQKPQLTDIAFEPSPSGGPICLRVCIPHEQPPDVYTGVVVDKQTNLPRGTLSIRITE